MLPSLQCRFWDRPKFYGSTEKFLVTQQMIDIWTEIENSKGFLRLVPVGPMGIGKSYLSYFLAAMAFASCYRLLYFVIVFNFLHISGN